MFGRRAISAPETADTECETSAGEHESDDSDALRLHRPASRRTRVHLPAVPQGQQEEEDESEHLKARTEQDAAELRLTAEQGSGVGGTDVQQPRSHQQERTRREAG